MKEQRRFDTRTVHAGEQRCRPDGDVEQADIVEARRRRQIRVLFEDIETLCRTAVSGGYTLQQLKNQIAARIS